MESIKKPSAVSKSCIRSRTYRIINLELQPTAPSNRGNINATYNNDKYHSFIEQIFKFLFCLIEKCF